MTITTSSSLLEDDIFFRNISFGLHFKKENRDEMMKMNFPIPSNTSSIDSRKKVPTTNNLDFFGDNAEILSTTENSKDTKEEASVLNPTTYHKKAFNSEQDMHNFRARKMIRVLGQDVPWPSRTFGGFVRHWGMPLSLHKQILTAKKDSIKFPTPVQMQATTLLLSGRDGLVVAPTGSGKTLAFIMSILTPLIKDPHHKGPYAIIVTPTRELALQIRDEFRTFTPLNALSKPIASTVLLSKAVINGWKAVDQGKTTFVKDDTADHKEDNIEDDDEADDKEDDDKEEEEVTVTADKRPLIIITTPNRLLQAISGGLLDLSHCKQLILDEVDNLLGDEGLLKQVDGILEKCTNPSLTKSLFSATIPSGVEELSRGFLSPDVVRVTIGNSQTGSTTEKIKQSLVYAGHEEGKLLAIKQMLLSGELKTPTMIFSETKVRAQALFDYLKSLGPMVKVGLIHGSKTQGERERMIRDFRSGDIWFLITTELLARGLDIPNVASIINYDFPSSTASYIHRIGRTGRAGKSGEARTLFTDNDSKNLRIVVNVMKQSSQAVPEWMEALVLREKMRNKKTPLF